MLLWVLMVVFRFVLFLYDYYYFANGCSFPTFFVFLLLFIIIIFANGCPFPTIC